MPKEPGESGNKDQESQGRRRTPRKGGIAPLGKSAPEPIVDPDKPAETDAAQMADWILGQLQKKKQGVKK